MQPSFSNRIGQVPPPNAIAQALAEFQLSGKSVINLSDSNPVRQGLAPAGIGDYLLNAGATCYDPDPRGLKTAREALAEDAQCHPDQLFLTASTSEAYAWTFKLFCDPGDCILVPKPGYPLFEWLAKLEGVRVVYYPLEYAHPTGWMIDVDAMAALVSAHRPKIVVAINPNNPTGSYVRGSERTALRDLCAAHGVALVSDEVFLRFNLDASAPARSLAEDSECLTLALDGLSKSLCLPQMKLGWIRLTGHEEQVRRASERLEIIADSFLSTSAPIMHALLALLARREEVVAQVRDRMRQNLAHLRESVGQGVMRVLRCDGGWTALLECPRVMDDDSLALALLREEGVLVQPGYFFDFETRGYLAISLILEPALFERGVTKLMVFMERLLS